jgi:DNA-binding response OmpR family regulator
MPCSLNVKTDVPLLRRLLQNFLTNACRYAPSGQILFGARRRGSFVELQVIDTGIGIPKDKLNEIFEEFRRFTEIGGEGYGLGLSIVRRISRLINCPVQVRSKLGKGSMFSVSVPIATGASEPVEVAPSMVAERASVGGIRVVVVENEPDVLDGMAGLLNTWSCDVIAASDEAGALAELVRRGDQPHIILADFHLDRGRVGTDVIAAIRKHCNADVPAAIITADRNSEIQHLVQQMGATLLVKPIKPARLRALISSVR